VQRADHNKVQKVSQTVPKLHSCSQSPKFCCVRWDLRKPGKQARRAVSRWSNNNNESSIFRWM